jgi:hypothetical protein
VRIVNLNGHKRRMYNNNDDIRFMEEDTQGKKKMMSQTHRLVAGKWANRHH